MEKIKLLVIDDNVELVKALKEYFKNNESIEVTLTAYNGQEGFDLIFNKQDKYDIIVLDIIMPIKDGIYVLSSMRENKIDKDVVVTTSFPSGEETTLLSAKAQVDANNAKDKNNFFININLLFVLFLQIHTGM